MIKAFNFNKTSLKKLRRVAIVGVASLALIVPMAMSGAQSAPVHADYQAHDATARYFERADASIPKSEKEHDEQEGAAADASEQRYEQDLIKRDPSAAGMYADEPDNTSATKAVIKEAVIKHPQDQDKAMLKRYHVHYTPRTRHYNKHANVISKHPRTRKGRLAQNKQAKQQIRKYTVARRHASKKTKRSLDSIIRNLNRVMARNNKALKNM